MGQPEDRAKLWCPGCRKLTTTYGPEDVDSSRRGNYPLADRGPGGHRDNPWGRLRHRACSECHHRWFTVEIPEDFLNALLEARKQMHDLRTEGVSPDAETGQMVRCLEAFRKSLYASIHHDRVRPEGSSENAARAIARDRTA